VGFQETQTAVVTTGSSTTDALDQFFTITGKTDPAYLVVNALDRNEYTVSASGDTGDFSGNGNTLDFASTGGDGYGAGIVFTWQSSTDQYVNATYGAFNRLDYTSSDSQNDVTNISLFTTPNAALANACASNAYALMQEDAAGYVGSVTFANAPNFSGNPPAQATPDAVAAAALNFVGDAWNDNGCWILASTIAAEAGAGLPVQSTAIGVAGRANGEWTVIYNGPGGASGNWENLVSEGDIITFATAGGGGHITTCVSGSGATAMLVDNITYENARGQISNSANDGSKNDVLVSAPHPASQEWNGVAGSGVVIYALDTPVISDTTASVTLDVGGTLSLSSVFAAKDPAGKAITSYQVYNSVGSDTIMLGGEAVNGASSSAPVTAASLSKLSLLAGASAVTDTLEIRAFNGTYWGDWQTLVVNVVVPTPEPPVLGTKTANQALHQGEKVNLLLPATLFKDPQGQALTYAASGANGTSLPSWLAFNAATRDFTGTVPAGTESFLVSVTATDTAGLSASETFSVNVAATAGHISLADWQSGTLADAAPQQAGNSAVRVDNLAVYAFVIDTHTVSETFGPHLEHF